MTEPVSHIRIDWLDPYAVNFEVQYWVAEKPSSSEGPMDHPTSGIWTTFHNGTVTNDKGDARTLQLSSHSSSGALSPHLDDAVLEHRRPAAHRNPRSPKDPRSAVGYAIRELYVGTLTDGGELVDLVQHRADQDQTTTYCSSVDPWHEPRWR